MRILQYEITLPGLDGSGFITLPLGSRILHVNAQDARLFLWARVPDADAPMRTMRLEVVGTGEEFSDDGRAYLGTVMMRELGLVWHVFAESSEV